MRFLFAYICLTIALVGDISDLVIIGGGPAGLTSGIYGARSGLSTLVIEGDEPGGQIGLSYNVENYPGFPSGINGAELGKNMHDQMIRFGAKSVTDSVSEVDFSSRPFRLKLKGGKEILAKTVVIATGSRTRWLGIPSEEALLGKGVNSCAVCDGFLFRDKEVAVIGGGDAALEDALYLAKFASKVTVIHRKDKLRASQALQTLAFANPKIHFIYDVVVEEIFDVNKGMVEGLYLKNVHTGKSTIFSCNGVFIAIGHIPNTTLFAGQLKLDKAGYIKTEPYSTKTSIPGIFAAGDVADSHYRQAIVAAGSGSMAAIDAFQYLQNN